ncbi:MAG: hypothetical protein K1000chlam2_00773 [Chlamydiae bacterium]|nr:hypothetical protein [Chlamydiota bacterium]
MTTSIYKQTSVNNTNCSVCLVNSDTSNLTWVCHTGKDGKLHPLHRDCARELFKKIVNFPCPTCRVPVNPNMLFTSKERFALFLKNNAPKISQISGIALTTLGSMTITFSSDNWPIDIGSTLMQAIISREMLKGNLGFISIPILIANGYLFPDTFSTVGIFLASIGAFKTSIKVQTLVGLGVGIATVQNVTSPLYLLNHPEFFLFFRALELIHPQLLKPILFGFFSSFTVYTASFNTFGGCCISKGIQAFTSYTIHKIANRLFS